MDPITVIVLLLVAAAVLFVVASIRVVPQSKVYVLERFGKYERTMHPGLNFLFPALEYVGHKVSVLERQLPTHSMSVITKDNVQINLTISVFYRVVEAQMAVYRIENVDGAVATTTAAIIRAACGELEFDDVQSKRDHLNSKIKGALAEATRIWGIEITRTEILDVIVGEAIRKTMELQMAADRERRSVELKAQGERTAVQLAADAELYRAQKQAEAIRVKADADAYATTVIAQAIADKGQAAIDFEIMKRKVDAITNLSMSANSKILILPSDVTGVLGGLETVSELLRGRGGSKT
ncbi:MAG: SPFH domain-containing protein [Hyphomicrobiaceae bacterium]